MADTPSRESWFQGLMEKHGVTELPPADIPTDRATWFSKLQEKHGISAPTPTAPTLSLTDIAPVQMPSALETPAPTPPAAVAPPPEIRTDTLAEVVNTNIPVTSAETGPSDLALTRKIQGPILGLFQQQPSEAAPQPEPAPQPEAVQPPPQYKEGVAGTEMRAIGSPREAPTPAPQPAEAGGGAGGGGGGGWGGEPVAPTKPEQGTFFTDMENILTKPGRGGVLGVIDTAAEVGARLFAEAAPSAAEAVGAAHGLNPKLTEEDKKALTTDVGAALTTFGRGWLEGRSFGLYVPPELTPEQKRVGGEYAQQIGNLIGVGGAIKSIATKVPTGLEVLGISKVAPAFSKEFAKYALGEAAVTGFIYSLLDYAGRNAGALAAGTETEPGFAQGMISQGAQLGAAYLGMPEVAKTIHEGTKALGPTAMALDFMGFALGGMVAVKAMTSLVAGIQSRMAGRAVGFPKTPGEFATQDINWKTKDVSEAFDILNQASDITVGRNPEAYAALEKARNVAIKKNPAFREAARYRDMGNQFRNPDGSYPSIPEIQAKIDALYQETAAAKQEVAKAERANNAPMGASTDEADAVARSDTKTAMSTLVPKGKPIGVLGEDITTDYRGNLFGAKPTPLETPGTGDEVVASDTATAQQAENLSVNISTKETAPEAEAPEAIAERDNRVKLAEEEYRLTNIAKEGMWPTDRQTKLVKNPPKEVTIYRSVPADSTQEEVRPGDWVAVDKKYAEQHGGAGETRLIAMKVPAQDVVWAGTDENEWFYAPANQSQSYVPPELQKVGNFVRTNEVEGYPYKERGIDVADVKAGEPLADPQLNRMFNDLKSTVYFNEEGKPHIESEDANSLAQSIADGDFKEASRIAESTHLLSDNDMAVLRAKATPTPVQPEVKTATTPEGKVTIGDKEFTPDHPIEPHAPEPLKRSAWNGDMTPDTSFVVDGVLMIRRDAIAPLKSVTSILEKPHPSITEARRGASQEGTDRIWNESVDSADKTVYVVGREVLPAREDVEKSKPTPIVWLATEDGKTVPLVQSQFDLAVKATGADNFKMDKAEKPVVLYKGTEPVAILMPMGKVTLELKAAKAEKVAAKVASPTSGERKQASNIKPGDRIATPEGVKTVESVYSTGNVTTTRTLKGGETITVPPVHELAIKFAEDKAPYLTGHDSWLPLAAAEKATPKKKSPIAGVKVGGQANKLGYTVEKVSKAGQSHGRGPDNYRSPARYQVMQDGVVVATLESTNKKNRYMDTQQWELREANNLGVKYFSTFQEAKAAALAGKIPTGAAKSAPKQIAAPASQGQAQAFLHNVINQANKAVETAATQVGQTQDLLDEEHKAASLKKVEKALDAFNEDHVEGVDEVRDAIDEYRNADRADKADAWASVEDALQGMEVNNDAIREEIYGDDLKEVLVKEHGLSEKLAAKIEAHMLEGDATPKSVDKILYKEQKPAAAPKTAPKDEWLEERDRAAANNNSPAVQAVREAVKTATFSKPTKPNQKNMKGIEGPYTSYMIQEGNKPEDWVPIHCVGCGKVIKAGEEFYWDVNHNDPYHSKNEILTGRYSSAIAEAQHQLFAIKALQSLNLIREQKTTPTVTPPPTKKVAPAASQEVVSEEAPAKTKEKLHPLVSEKGGWYYVEGSQIQHSSVESANKAAEKVAKYKAENPVVGMKELLKGPEKAAPTQKKAGGVDLSTRAEASVPVRHEFLQAVADTPGAALTPDGLQIKVTRFQKPEQTGATSVRTGVFFLTEKDKNIRHYGKPHYPGAEQWYGGTEKIKATVVFKNPVVAKGNTGGLVPEKVYSMLRGPDAFKELSDDIGKAVHQAHIGGKKDPILGQQVKVLQAEIRAAEAEEYLKPVSQRDLYSSKLEFMRQRLSELIADFNATGDVVTPVRDLLTKYGGDPSMAEFILEHSKKGNQLRYALQEHIVAHAVRDAGYDGVIGYSMYRGRGRITEVFDVRQGAYPTNTGVFYTQKPSETAQVKAGTALVGQTISPRLSTVKKTEIPITTPKDVADAVRHVTEVLAPEHDINLAPIVFSGEDRVFDVNTTRGLREAREYGIPEEEIQDAQKHGQRIRVAGEHKVFAAGKGRQGRSEITLHNGASATDVYHEYAHALDRQGKLKGWEGTSEQKAKYLESQLMMGKRLEDIAPFKPTELLTDLQNIQNKADPVDFAIRIDSETPGEHYDTITGVVVANTGVGKPVTTKVPHRQWGNFGTAQHDEANARAWQRIYDEVPDELRKGVISLGLGNNKLEDQPLFSLSTGCGRNATIYSAIQAGILPKEYVKFMVSCHYACYKNHDTGALSGGSPFAMLLRSARVEMANGKPGEAVDYFLKFSKQLGMEYEWDNELFNTLRAAIPGPRAFNTKVTIPGVTQAQAKKLGVEPYKSRKVKAVVTPYGAAGPVTKKNAISLLLNEPLDETREEDNGIVLLKQAWQKLPLEKKTALWKQLLEDGKARGWLPQEAMQPIVATPEMVRNFLNKLTPEQIKRFSSMEAKFIRGNQAGDWLHEVNAGSSLEFIQGLLDRNMIGKNAIVPKKITVVTSGFYVDVPMAKLREYAKRFGKEGADVLVVQVTGPWDFKPGEAELRRKGIQKLRDAGLNPVIRMITDEYRQGGVHLSDPQTIKETTQWMIDNDIRPNEVLETHAHIDDPGFKINQYSSESVTKLIERVETLFAVSPEDAEVMARGVIRRNIAASEKKGGGEHLLGLSYENLRDNNLITPAQEAILRERGFTYKITMPDGSVKEGVFPQRCCTTGKCKTCPYSCAAEYKALFRSVDDGMVPAKVTAETIDWDATDVAAITQPGRDNIDFSTHREKVTDFSTHRVAPLPDELAVPKYKDNKVAWQGAVSWAKYKAGRIAEKQHQMIMRVTGEKRWGKKSMELDKTITQFIDHMRDPWALATYYNLQPDEVKGWISKFGDIAGNSDIQQIIDAITARGEEIAMDAEMAGIITEAFEHYQNRIYKFEKKPGHEAHTKMKLTSRHALLRKYMTRPEARVAGLTYKVESATENLRILGEEIGRVKANREEVARGLKQGYYSTRQYEGWRMLPLSMYKREFVIKAEPNAIIAEMRRMTQQIRSSTSTTTTTTGGATPAGLSGAASGPVAAMKDVIRTALEARGMTTGEADAYLNRVEAAAIRAAQGQQPNATAAQAGAAPPETITTVIKEVRDHLTTIEKSQKVIGHRYDEVRRKDIYMDKDGNIFLKRPLYAPAEIAKDVKNVVGTVEMPSGLQLITQYNAIAKALNLSYSTFHLHSFMRNLLTNPLGFWKMVHPIKYYRQGKNSIENNHPYISLLINNGLETFHAPPDWSELHVDEKTALGRLADKTWVTRKTRDLIWRGVEANVNFTFQKVGNAYKMQYAIDTMEYLKKKYPAMTDNELAYAAAQHTNDVWGGRNEAVAGALFGDRKASNPHMRVASRLILLARDWTMSNLSLFKRSFERGPSGKLARQYWAFALAKTFTAVIAINLAMALGDDLDAWEAFKVAWHDPKQLRWLDVNLTPLYRLANKVAGMEPDEARKYLRVGGHFYDVFKMIFNPVQFFHHKQSILARFFNEMLKGEDWRGNTFTTLSEMLGMTDSIAGPLTGQLTKEGRSKGSVSWAQMPSFALHQIRGVIPIPAQNMLYALMGEMDGFTAAIKTAGGMASSFKERTDAQDMMSEYYQNVSPVVKSPGQKARTELKKELLKVYHKGDVDTFTERLQDAIDSGTISHQEAQQWADEAPLPKTAQAFIKLPLDMAMKVIKEGNDQERKLWTPYLIQKVSQADPHTILARQEELAATFRELGAEEMASQVEVYQDAKKAKPLKVVGPDLAEAHRIDALENLGIVDAAGASILRNETLRPPKVEKPKSEKPVIGSVSRERNRLKQLLGLRS